ncbi:hypothetical protein NpPPO83_00004812 [Neofusicoccum parvum]|uniref:Uncharacterized protein n=1 Tax=Neofusicoccum parvum TaxID=310453 RepID=A0ACB5RUN3_9PEZI|nr:hypothetical protein NpPPO83_00004812 [Neofusicoccum parvum]
MCRAVSYQYDCGASFHKIFPCEQRCFTCIAPENLLQPANAAPRSANATNANGDTPATNPAGTASTSAAATNTVSDANSRADNADSVNSSDSNTTIKSPEPNTTTTNNTAATTTTTTSSTPSQPTSNRPSIPAPAPTSTITPAHAHRIARACYDRAAAPAPAPTLWTRLRRQLRTRRRSARARRTDDDGEAVLALGPDDAGTMARVVTERRVVRVAGRCPACEGGRGGREEEAWAVVATFLGED